MSNASPLGQLLLGLISGYAGQRQKMGAAAEAQQRQAAAEAEANRRAAITGMAQTKSLPQAMMMLQLAQEMGYRPQGSVMPGTMPEAAAAAQSFRTNQPVAVPGTGRPEAEFTRYAPTGGQTNPRLGEMLSAMLASGAGIEDLRRVQAQRPDSESYPGQPRVMEQRTLPAVPAEMRQYGLEDVRSAESGMDPMFRHLYEQQLLSERQRLIEEGRAQAVHQDKMKTGQSGRDLQASTGALRGEQAGQVAAQVRELSVDAKAKRDLQKTMGQLNVAKANLADRTDPNLRGKHTSNTARLDINQALDENNPYRAWKLRVAQNLRDGIDVDPQTEWVGIVSKLIQTKSDQRVKAMKAWAALDAKSPRRKRMAKALEETEKALGELQKLVEQGDQIGIARKGMTFEQASRQVQTLTKSLDRKLQPYADLWEKDVERAGRAYVVTPGATPEDRPVTQAPVVYKGLLGDVQRVNPEKASLAAEAIKRTLVWLAENPDMMSSDAARAEWNARWPDLSAPDIMGLDEWLKSLLGDELKGE